jgi:hypothetical protein
LPSWLRNICVSFGKEKARGLHYLLAIAQALKSARDGLQWNHRRCFFYFIKALRKLVSRGLMLLADICLKLKYYLTFLKTFYMIILYKLKKAFISL